MKEESKTIEQLNAEIGRNLLAVRELLDEEDYEQYLIVMGVTKTAARRYIEAHYKTHQKSQGTER